MTSARQRAESIQQTPIAVTFISQADLDTFHASTINDLTDYTPNLQLHTTGWTVTYAPLPTMAADMQPTDGTLQLIRRLAHAVDDLGAQNSF